VDYLKTKTNLTVISDIHYLDSFATSTFVLSSIIYSSIKCLKLRKYWKTMTTVNTNAMSIGVQKHTNLSYISTGTCFHRVLDYIFTSLQYFFVASWLIIYT